MREEEEKIRAIWQNWAVFWCERQKKEVTRGSSFEQFRWCCGGICLFSVHYDFPGDVTSHHSTLFKQKCYKFRFLFLFLFARRLSNMTIFVLRASFSLFNCRNSSTFNELIETFVILYQLRSHFAFEAATLWSLIWGKSDQVLELICQSFVWCVSALSYISAAAGGDHNNKTHRG